VISVVLLPVLPNRGYGPWQAVNPYQLWWMVVLIAAIMVLAHGLHEWFGQAGVLALSAVSGIADVDAITLSLARMTGEGLGLRTAVLGLVLAAAVNNLVKAGMTAFIGGATFGMRAGLPLVISAVAGLITAAFLQP
jgi:uncharacterized membrane protein (DUF4010 family)